MNTETYQVYCLKILVFDMGHVIVDFDWKKICEGFCQATGRTIDELKIALKKAESLGYESGKITTRDFVAEFNKYFNANLSVE